MEETVWCKNVKIITHWQYFHMVLFLWLSRFLQFKIIDDAFPFHSTFWQSCTNKNIILMIPFLSFAKNCFWSLYQEKNDSTPNFCNDRIGLYNTGHRSQVQVTALFINNWDEQFSLKLLKTLFWIGLGLGDTLKVLYIYLAQWPVL